jgi:hypothetical protein
MKEMIGISDFAERIVTLGVKTPKIAARAGKPNEDSKT